MKVIATNIAKPTVIQWKGKTENTGIFKYPVEAPIYLEKEAVKGDTIADRRVHGGSHKACYLFSTKHYTYWKSRFPGLEWNWGMFGENLSVEGMDENEWRIGDIFRIGNALVEVSMPREPCYKLGIRFGTQEILNEFIEYGYPGTYVRVLEPGNVRTGDQVQLEEAAKSELTVRQFFKLLYSKHKSRNLLEMAMQNEALPPYKKDFLRRYI